MRLRFFLFLLGLTFLSSVSCFTVEEGGASLSVFPAYHHDELSCEGNSCPSELLVRIDATALAGDGLPTCSGINSALSSQSDAWGTRQLPGGMTLNVAPVVRAFYSEDCASTSGVAALRTAVAQALTRDDGEEPPELVVEIRQAEVDSESQRMCWTYPSKCEGDKVHVIIYIQSFCSSSCGSDAEPTCSKACVHGECVGPNTCLCEEGFDGATCSTLPGCDSDGCSGHGMCDKDSGLCDCDVGYTGDACESEIPATPAPTQEPREPYGDRVWSEDWMNPFTIFPEGFFTHFGHFSNGQIPRTDRHCPGSEAKNGTGYAAVYFDRSSSLLHFQVAFTAPREKLCESNSTNDKVNYSLCGASVEMRRGHLGVDGDLLSVLTKDHALCRIPSWVSDEWDALGCNGTIAVKDVDGLFDLFEDNGVHMLIKTSAIPEGLLRAQLMVFDRALNGTFLNVFSKAEGAALFLVDEKREQVQTWVYYTAPLDYVEITAEVFDGNIAVYPLERGTAFIRRIGFYDRFNDPPQQLVCVLNKVGIWQYGRGDRNATEITNGLRAGRYGVKAHSATFRTDALSGSVQDRD